MTTPEMAQGLADLQYRVADIERLARQVNERGGSPLSPIRRKTLYGRLSTPPVFLLGSTSFFAAGRSDS